MAEHKVHDMSKGNNFRGPKKRGFDDDGPMDYESRGQRDRPRGFDSPPGDFGGASTGGFQPRTGGGGADRADRKSTRLNSSHG